MQNKITEIISNYVKLEYHIVSNNATDFFSFSKHKIDVVEANGMRGNFILCNYFILFIVFI